jgi:hypothetical protein
MGTQHSARVNGGDTSRFHPCHVHLFKYDGRWQASMSLPYKTADKYGIVRERINAYSYGLGPPIQAYVRLIMYVAKEFPNLSERIMHGIGARSLVLVEPEEEPVTEDIEVTFVDVFSIDRMLANPGIYNVFDSARSYGYFRAEVTDDGTCHQLTPGLERDGVFSRDKWYPTAFATKYTGGRDGDKEEQSCLNA